MLNTDKTKDRWVRLKVLTEKTITTPEHLKLSQNSKTGISLNVSIVGSCRPTKNCRSYCYGIEGPIAWPASIALEKSNLNLFNSYENADDQTIKAEATRIAKSCKRRGFDYIRINAVGDLVPGYVRFLNALAVEDPKLQLWVATRKPELAGQIQNLPNVHIMFGVDSTTNPKSIEEMRMIVESRPKNAFLSYVQLQEHENVPEDVKLIFLEHQKSKRAAWKPDTRACPATVDKKHGGKDHDDACANCRYCFTSKS